MNPGTQSTNLPTYLHTYFSSYRDMALSAGEAQPPLPLPPLLLVLPLLLLVPLLVVLLLLLLPVLLLLLLLLLLLAVVVVEVVEPLSLPSQKRWVSER